MQYAFKREKERERERHDTWHNIPPRKQITLTFKWI